MDPSGGKKTPTMGKQGPDSAITVLKNFLISLAKSMQEPEKSRLEKVLIDMVKGATAKKNMSTKGQRLNVQPVMDFLLGLTYDKKIAIVAKLRAQNVGILNSGKR